MPQKSNTSPRAAQLDRALKAVWARAMADSSVYLFGDELQASLVKTIDEHDFNYPIKPLPDRPHLRSLNYLWETNQQLAVAKSRQMMVSWFCMARVTWEVFHPGRMWGVTCKKFEDADALLERAWHIIQAVPEPLRPKAERKQGAIKVHHSGASSTLLALSQDSDAPRSRTFSGIIIDEAAFTDNLEKLYTAAKPTVMAGGKLILVSSPNGRGYFYEVLSDQGRLEL